MKKDPMTGYLNINFFRTKILNLKEIYKVPINIFCIDETKLDGAFPGAQFYDRKLAISNF